MRTIHIRCGIEPVGGSKMLCVGISTETTKPNPNKKVLATAIAILAFAASIWLLNITDANTNQQHTIDISEVAPWR